MNNNNSYTENSLDKIASTWDLDVFYVFLITPMNAIAFVFNTLSFIILYTTTKPKKVFYQYLQVYSFNASLGSLLAVCSYWTFSPLFNEFAWSQHARVYRCVIFGFIGGTLYFFSNLLDVIIVIERLSLLFNFRFKYWNHKSPYLLSVVLYAACALVNLPLLFMIRGKSDDELAIEANNTDKEYCSQVEFSKTVLGIIIDLVSFVVRDIITLGLEVTFSIMSIVKVHKFRVEYSETSHTGNRLEIKIYDTERRLVYLIIYLSLLSIASHFISFLSSVSFFIISLEHIFGDYLNLIAVFSTSIKLISNFFIIFSNSRLFRIQFKNIFHIPNC